MFTKIFNAVKTTIEQRPGTSRSLMKRSCYFSCVLILLSCSDSGNDEERIPWEPNVFTNSADFSGKCATVDENNDPGSANALNERHFLRAYSNETYLWYNEILDQDPAQFTTENYFSALKTTATTASGRNKDRFHFSIPTDEWEALSQSGVSLGYGAKWLILSEEAPRLILVGFTEADSPAEDAQLARGARVIGVNGIDVVGTTSEADVDIINEALFPSSTASSYEFEIMDFGASTSRTVTLTPGPVQATPVRNTRTIDTADGRVGYLLFNDHIATAESGLFNAISTLAEDNIDDLVLDLRYNGGGFLSIASQLAYMIAGDTQTTNKIFDRQIFNDKHQDINPVTKRPITPTPFYNTTRGTDDDLDTGLALPTLDLERVFILTGSRTCSASEAIINGLLGIDVEVILIGNTTCGKPYGFYPVDNCGNTYFTIQFSGANDKNFGDFGDGFTPQNHPDTGGARVTGCAVADDFSKPLGDPEEQLFAAALAYRENNTCPALTQSKQGEGLEKSSPGTLGKAEWFNSRPLNGKIMRR